MSQRLSRQSAQPRSSRPAPRYPTLAAAGLALGLLGCGGSTDEPQTVPQTAGGAPDAYSDASVPPQDTAPVRDTLPNPDGLPVQPYYDAGVPDTAPASDTLPQMGGAIPLPFDAAPPVDLRPAPDTSAPDSGQPIGNPAGGIGVPYEPDAGSERG